MRGKEVAILRKFPILPLIKRFLVRIGRRQRTSPEALRDSLDYTEQNTREGFLLQKGNGYEATVAFVDFVDSHPCSPRCPA